MTRSPTGATIIALSLYAWTASAGLAVYDCEAPGVTYDKVDLTGPAECPDPIKDYLPAVNQTFQILQTDSDLPITAYQCFATVTKEVTRCGFNSLTYASSWPIWEELQEITPSECREAVKTGKMTIDNKVYDVELNTKLVKNFYSRGGVNADGGCTVEDFMSGGINFANSYERTTITAKLNVVRGLVNLAEGIIEFHNHVKAQFKDTMYRDQLTGIMVWDAREPPCHETVSEVYHGLGLVHSRKAGYGVKYDRFNNAILMISDEARDQAMGMVLKAPSRICGAHCYTTQIGSLVACPLRNHDAPIPRTEFKASFAQETIAAQMSLSSSHLGTNQRMYRRFEQIQGDLCRVEWKGLNTRLQALAGTNNPYSLLDHYGPGHAVLVGGAAAYVTKCMKADGIRTAYPNCTHEIPVKVNGTLRFADPLTWVLRDYPTVVPCSDINPVRWKIHDNWYCATPEISSCEPPRVLRTESSVYRDEDFTSSLEKNVYTPEQRSMHRKFQQSFWARVAVIYKISNTATGNGHVGYEGRELGMALDKMDMESIKMDVGSFLFPLFPLFGKAWNQFMGLVIVALICKVVLGTIVRAWVIYQKKGFGCWILLSFWSTALAIVDIPLALVCSAWQQVQTPRNEDDDRVDALNEARDRWENGEPHEIWCNEPDDDDDDDRPSGGGGAIIRESRRSSMRSSSRKRPSSQRRHSFAMGPRYLTPYNPPASTASDNPPSYSNVYKDSAGRQPQTLYPVNIDETTDEGAREAASQRLVEQRLLVGTAQGAEQRAAAIAHQGARPKVSERRARSPTSTLERYANTASTALAAGAAAALQNNPVRAAGLAAISVAMRPQAASRIVGLNSDGAKSFADGASGMSLEEMQACAKARDEARAKEDERALEESLRQTERAQRETAEAVARQGEQLVYDPITGVWSYPPH